MKIKVVIVILVVACVGLVIAFFATKKQADDQHTADVVTIVDFSNQVVTASQHLEELGQVNLTLSNDLAASQQQLTFTTDQLTLLSNSLASASATITATRTSLASTEELVTNLNSRIADLEAQNKALDEQAVALTNTIALLNGQIENTKSQLAVSEKNRGFLQIELKKQLAQKADLERRFNNLDELRGQVRKIKDEMFVARRLQLMRNDLGGKKGAELLRQRTVSTPRPAATNSAPNYDLNVEVGSDGSVKVIAPLGGTNSPAK